MTTMRVLTCIVLVIFFLLRKSSNIYYYIHGALGQVWKLRIFFLLQALHSLLTDAMTSHKEFEMLLALKSIGNAGQPVSLKPVMKFLSDNYPDYIQLEAVRAIVQIGNQDPTKVKVTE